jgi:hypothetical protein
MFAQKISRVLSACIAATACLAVSQMNSAAAAITTSPAQIDGWTISWPTSIGVQVSQDASSSIQVDLQKTAIFTAPNQGFQISFAPTPGSPQTASLFVFTNESITDDTGKPFGDLSFILINDETVDATFSKVFLPPVGAGYDYTNESLANGNQEADYTGTQANGVTSSWGNGIATASGNNLSIIAPAGAIFSFKELSVPQVPEPASLGLFVLAGFGILRRSERPSSAK